MRAYCPKGCKETNGFLFGTQIYYEESSICKAAVHDGKIDDEKGGEFIIKIVDSPKVFFGENSRGVSSATLQIEKKTSAFTLEKAPFIIEAKCDTLASDEKKVGKF